MMIHLNVNWERRLSSALKLAVPPLPVRIFWRVFEDYAPDWSVEMVCYAVVDSDISPIDQASIVACGTQVVRNAGWLGKLRVECLSLEEASNRHIGYEDG